MDLSSSFSDSGLVGSAVAQHRVEDVNAATSQGDDGLVVALALGSLARVEGAAGGWPSEQKAD